MVVNTEDDDYSSMDIGFDCKVPTPEANCNHVNALVMLPIGNSYDIGKATRRKRDADGNTVGRKNDNPILDTRIEFDDGEIS